MGQTGIANRDNFYFKVMQYSRQMRETERVIDFGNVLLYSSNILPLGILEKLEFCYNHKKEEITNPTTDVST